MVKEKTEKEAWDETISYLDKNEKEKWERRIKGVRKRQWSLLAILYTIIVTVFFVAIPTSIEEKILPYIGILLFAYIWLIYTYFVKSSFQLYVEEKYGKSDEEENQND